MLLTFHASIKKSSFHLYLSLTGAHCHENIRTKFRILNMSVPELPSKISSPEYTLQTSLRRVYILIEDMRSDLTKLQERLKNMFNSMISQHQNFKLQMKPQEVTGSDLSLSKETSRTILFLADMDPDLSAGIDSGRGISRLFYKPSNIDPHTSRLQTQTRFVTKLSCYLKPDTKKHTSRKIIL